MTAQLKTQWQSVCSTADLVEDSGVAALLNGKQITIFYIKKLNAIYAIDNYCPFSNANVISRGIIGSLTGQTVVASPIYKQHFNLETGQCLEDSEVTLNTYPVKIEQDTVLLAI